MNEESASAPTEQTIWSGSSSQVRNLHVYILCAIIAGAFVAGAYVAGRLPESGLRGAVRIALGAGAAISLLYALVRFIQLRSVRYELTTQRIRARKGVFSRRTDELELYRVKDVTVFEPFWQRLFGLGDIVITTNDASTPTLTLAALPSAAQTREALRNAVEDCRDRKRVRIAELE